MIAVDIPITNLVPLACNRDLRKVNQLEAQVHSVGGILNPLHVWELPDGRHEVWCGNKRLHVAVKIGFATVPCIVHTPSELRPGELVDTLRSRIVAADGESVQANEKDQLAMYVRSAGKILPTSKQVAADISFTEEVFGPEGPGYILQNGAPVRTCRNAKEICDWMQRKCDSNRDGAVPSIATTSRWLIRHGGQKILHHIRRRLWPALALRKLRGRISKDLPITLAEME